MFFFPRTIRFLIYNVKILWIIQSLILRRTIIIPLIANLAYTKLHYAPIKPTNLGGNYLFFFSNIILIFITYMQQLSSTYRLEFHSSYLKWFVSFVRRRFCYSPFSSMFSDSFFKKNNYLLKLVKFTNLLSIHGLNDIES